jgi:hypothetical protein
VKGFVRALEKGEEVLELPYTIEDFDYPLKFV